MSPTTIRLMHISFVSLIMLSTISLHLISLSVVTRTKSMKYKQFVNCSRLTQ